MSRLRANRLGKLIRSRRVAPRFSFLSLSLLLLLLLYIRCFFCLSRRGASRKWIRAVWHASLEVLLRNIIRHPEAETTTRTKYYDVAAARGVISYGERAAAAGADKVRGGINKKTRETNGAPWSYFYTYIHKYVYKANNVELPRPGPRPATTTADAVWLMSFVAVADTGSGRLIIY